MEKIAIISDVHANITALNAVLDDIYSRNIKRIFCLGDSITKCTHPDLVIDKLREVCEVMILGNSDYSICRPEKKALNFWTRKIIGEERANYIFNLPKLHEFYMSGHFIRLFHASPYSLEHIYNPMFSNKNTEFAGRELSSPEDLFKNTEFLEKTPEDKEPDIVGYGHLHTPCIVRYGNKTIFNPGSVGAPVEMLNSNINDKSNKFSTLASYIILEGNYGDQTLGSISFNLVRVPYDIQKELDYLESSDMPKKEMIMSSLKGALPTDYKTNRSETHG